jgi:hypothetical protein
MRTKNIKLIENEPRDIVTAVSPRYVKTNPSAILDIIFDTMLLSSLAWNERL